MPRARIHGRGGAVSRWPRTPGRTSLARLAAVSRVLPWVLLALLVCLPAAPLVARSAAPQENASDRVRLGRFLGSSLQDALKRLQERSGLQIVFTNRLVTPRLRVEVEPSGSRPEEILASLLEPHGLTAEDRGAGVWVVVASQGGEATHEDDPGGEARIEPMPYIEDEIVVRPSRISLLLEEPEGPMSFSRRDIENLPHLARDVFRALSLLPGVTGNDASAQFHVHGGRRDEVQLVLDGQELYEAFHLKEFDNAVSNVAAHGLDRVSLSTGAFPAERGDRMGGVLDMRTRPASGPRRGELGLSFSELYGLGSGRLGRRDGGWLVTGRRGLIDQVGRVLGDEDPDFWDLFGKLQGRWTPRQEVRGHVLLARDQLNFLQAIDGTDERFDTGYDTSYLWLTHQATVGDRGVVETFGSWSEIDRDRRGGDEAEDEFFTVSDRRRFEVFGGKQAWLWRVGSRQTWKAGWVVRRYDGRYDYRNDFERDEDDFNTDLAGDPVAALERDVRGEHVGAYLSDRVSLDRLALEVGLRYDRHTLTDDTLWSPRLNLAWKLAETHILRAAWGHFYQSQRPYELQVADGETEFFPAERSEHWVLGYEGILNADPRAPVHALRVELYRRDIRDPRVRYENLFETVSAFPEVEADRVRIAPTSSRAEGVEVVVRGAAGRRSQWWLHAGYASATDRVDGRAVRRNVDQEYTVNAYWEQPLGLHWSLNLAFRFHTGWPTTPVFLVAEEPEEPEDDEPALGFGVGPINSDTLASYHRLDVRASRSWAVPRGELTFFVDIQNLYDRRNRSGTDYEIDDGALVAKAERWPGILPSLGIRWKF